MKTTAGVFGSLALSRRVGAGETSGSRRPNIVIIYADDMGYGDLSCFGGDIPTPNIDSIAADGIRFTDFYVPAPVCTPSRYGLLTGCYPKRTLHGLDRVIMPGSSAHLDSIEATLADYLRTVGYDTAAFGKWHLGYQNPQDPPAGHGFDTFTGHIYGCMDYFYHTYGATHDTWYINNVLGRQAGYATDIIADCAISFVADHRQGGNPFFLYVPFNAPHYGKTDDSAYDPATTINLNAWSDRTNTLQAKVEDLARFSHVTDQYRRWYSAMVASLDDNVGRILDELRTAGLYDDTMIWFISDNGGYSSSYYGHADNGPLRGQKGSLREGGMRIPAMMCWKNGPVGPGVVSSQPCCNIDLVPTIGAITGYAAYQLCDRPIDGIDISSVLLDNGTIARDLFWKQGSSKALRRGKWKMYNGSQLYDLEADIAESTDLALVQPDMLSELNAAWDEINSRVTAYRVEPNACQRLQADISGPFGSPDGKVDIHDLSAMFANWRRCNNPQDGRCQ